MGGGVAADQVRGAGADAPAPGGIAQAGGDSRVAGEAEIIVAAEVEEAPAVDDDLPPLGPADDPPAAIEVSAPQVRESVSNGSGTGHAGNVRAAERRVV